jgi:hypothetical protein
VCRLALRDSVSTNRFHLDSDLQLHCKTWAVLMRLDYELVPSTSATYNSAMAESVIMPTLFVTTIRSFGVRVNARPGGKFE